MGNFLVVRYFSNIILFRIFPFFLSVFSFFYPGFIFIIFLKAFSSFAASPNYFYNFVFIYYFSKALVPFVILNKILRFILFFAFNNSPRFIFEISQSNTYWTVYSAVLYAYNNKSNPGTFFL